MADSSSSDSDCDGMAAAFDILDDCEPTETDDHGDIFRLEVTRAKAVHAAEKSTAGVIEVLAEADMGWFAATLTEYELDSISQLRSLFSSGTAVEVLGELGCTESDVRRLELALDSAPLVRGQDEVLAWAKQVINDGA